MSDDPAAADGLDRFRVEIVPPRAAFPTHVDDVAFSQYFDVFEDAGAAYVVKQVDQLARLLRPGCQSLNDQAPPPIAERLPDLVILMKLICHYLVTYEGEVRLSITTPSRDN